MENALQLLDKNKEEALDLLQRTLEDVDSRFADVQLAIHAVAAAAKLKKVRSKPDHLIKYVRLVSLIADNVMHREHLGVAHWQQLAGFLVDSGRLLGQANLGGFADVKASSDVLHGLHLLLKAAESVDPDLFDGVIEVCEQALDRAGSRETSCHLYAMGCARQLAYFGVAGAHSIASQVLQLGKIRNNELIYEALMYACLVGQPWDILLHLSPRLIPSHHVEFLSAPELGMARFRPTGEADLASFVGAIALSRSTEHLAQSNAAKRQKTEVTGLRLMRLAFAYNTADATKPAYSSNGPLTDNTPDSSHIAHIRNTSNPSYPEDADIAMALQWLETNPTVEDPATLFWAFTLLSLRVHPRELFRYWDLSVRYLSEPGCSSGACVLLSTLIPQLLSPSQISACDNVEKEIIGRISRLLHQMSSSPYPALTSGSLLLYDALHNIEILDERFQRMKREALNTWVTNRINIGESLNLMSQLIDYRAPILYFERDTWLDLAMVAEHTRIQAIIALDPRSVAKFSQRELVQPEIAGRFSITQLPPPKTLRDSLLHVALSAQSQQIPNVLYHSQTAAFSVEDLKAFSWFAGLANFVNWPDEYIDMALSLADWQVPAQKYPSISAALSLLQKPDPTIAMVISGTLTPAFSSSTDNLDSSKLLQMERFMKSYVYQRSPWFFRNLCRLIGLKTVKDSNEARQLRSYLLKLSSNQSIYSRLKKYLVQYASLSDDDLAKVLEQMDENSLLASLPYFPDRREFTVEDLSMYSARFAAALHLSLKEKFSVARLLLFAESEQRLKFQSAFPELALNTAQEIFSAFIVPMTLDFPSLLSDMTVTIPAGVAKRTEIFLRPIFSLNLSLNGSQIMAIVEQVMKETMYASDFEKARAIELNYSFIKAHMNRDEPASFIWENYLDNSCASLKKSDANALRRLEETALNILSSGCQISTRMAAALYSAGLVTVALEFLKRTDESSALKCLLKFDLGLHVKAVIDDLRRTGWSETWYMAIKSFVAAVQHLDFDAAFEACKHLRLPEVEAVIAWSRFLHIVDVRWLALCGRLGSHVELDFGKRRPSVLQLTTIHSAEVTESQQDEPFSMASPISLSVPPAGQRSLTMADDLMVASKGSIGNNMVLDKNIESFFSALLNLYSIVPYSKKRILNTFMLRANRLVGSAYPADIFGASNWSVEMDSRPLSIPTNNSEDVYIVQRLVDVSLELLNQPKFGPHVVEQVPELMVEVIPLLVTAAYAHRSESLHETKLLSEIQSLLSSCINSREGRKLQLALDVYQQCHRTNTQFSLGNDKVALTCVELVQEHNGDTLYYSELGSMAIELIWNGCPEKGISDELVEALRLFFEKISRYHDSSYKRALSKKKHIPTLAEITAETDKSQQLQAEMVYNEVLPTQNVTTFGRSFENSGLWNLAQRVQGSTNIYNLEKAWWLHQWDSYNPDISLNGIYENEEFGPLIGFLSGKLDAESSLAMLMKIHTPAINSLVHILYGNPLDYVDDDITRRAHELLTLKNGQQDKYISALQSACLFFRSQNDSNKLLEYASKLEKVIQDLGECNTFQEKDRVKVSLLDKARSVSLLENAHLQWMLGQQSSAIESLKGLLAQFDLSSGTASSASSPLSLANLNLHNEFSSHNAISTGAPFDVAEIYCQIGTWSREARNEPDSKILNTYFLEAVKYRNENNAEGLHHSFAVFCSQAYKDQYLQSSIQDSRHIVSNLNPQFKHITKIIKGGMDGFDTEKKHKLNKMYRSVHAQLKSSNSDLQELQKYKKSLLIRSAENFLLSMEAGDTYEDDMASFISLWLGHHQSLELNEMVNNRLGPRENTLKVAVRKFLPWISQLSSRLGASPPSSPAYVIVFQEALQHIILDAARVHPHHTLWQLFKIHTVPKSENKVSRDRANAAEKIIKEARVYRPEIVASIGEFFQQLIKLGSVKQQGEERRNICSIISLMGRKNSAFWRSKLPQLHLPVPTMTLPISHDGDYTQVPVIMKLIDPIGVAGGISAPKILEMVDSHGEMHSALLKTSNDDLRQDAIMEQVFAISSNTLNRRHRNLYVRTYNVIPLNATIGLIEFVKNTVALIDILENMHKKYGDGKNEFSLSQARKAMNLSRQNGRAERIAVYKEVMEHTRPQMRHYWMERFKDAASWLAAKTRWGRSSAVMSIVGYIIGLGDRHCSNLLVDSTNGDVIHIDLGIAFDQGKLLQIPETVPFRLTRDIVDGMGISGTAGVFMASAEATLQRLRDHHARILTVLEVLKHDTLYTWKLPVSVLQSVQMEDEDGAELPLETPQVDDGQAEHALLGVKNKLQDALSCEATVRDLVTQARDPRNLALIYSGWSPFY